MTNRQLYWMALARTYYAKIHPSVPESFYPLRRLVSEYLHVAYKRTPGFQDAFMCEMTDFEEKVLAKYLDRK